MKSSIFLLGLSFLVITSCNNKTSEEELPNILWLVSEDNSPLLGCYGDEFASTPNLDNMALQGIKYTHAYANAPVCAPTRSTLITGCYATSLGTQHMRSQYPLPENIRFFPQIMRENGYYCTNNSKEDYNTQWKGVDIWDESSSKANYINRPQGKPFFHVQNFNITHESRIHNWEDDLMHDPNKVKLPPYHPDTPEMRHDWAQYYDKVSTLDEQIGSFLQKLEDEGLAENTIVFYYSDHGGVLARSKRFVYESGTHVPLIIRFPKKYKKTAPGEPGSSLDQLVSFVDFAPTILSLARIKPPDYLQGKPFLGPYKTKNQDYAFMFRGRMDERYDMSRSVRSQEYRYIRNYMPDRIYGQHLNYLWKAPSCRSWEEAYLNGECNEIQSRFWETKPSEELYNTAMDPWEVNNLVDQPAFKHLLKIMRKACDDHILKVYDSGFIPEIDLAKIVGHTSIYDYTHSNNYPLEELLELANKAALRNPNNLSLFIDKLNDPNQIVRYWAIYGIKLLGQDAANNIPIIKKALNDPSDAVKLIAAELICESSIPDEGIKVLKEELKNSNDLVKLQTINIISNMDKEKALLFKDEISSLMEKADPNSKAYYLRAGSYLMESTFNKE